MSKNIQIQKTESIWGHVEEMRDQVTHRAYQIFKENGEALGRELDNWLQAEKELIWKPELELREKDNQFHVTILVPGFDMKDLRLEVTADDMVIRGESRHEHKAEKGEFHTCEISSGSLFRSIHFPKTIDPGKAGAEFKNGVLMVTADIAQEAAPEPIKAKAATAKTRKKA